MISKGTNTDCSYEKQAKLGKGMKVLIKRKEVTENKVKSIKKNMTTIAMTILTEINSHQSEKEFTNQRLDQMESNIR